MKKVALLIMSIGFFVALAGCSKSVPTPQESFRSYINDWQKQNFSAMYAKLSTKAKQQVSKKKFVSRYKKIYHDFNISGLTVTADFQKPKNKKKIDPNGDGKVQLPFTVKMNTMAGPVKFKEKATIVKEERKGKNKSKTTGWYVHWKTNMIFPQMTDPSIEVHAKTISAQRGEILDRQGRPLAENGEVASIGIWPGKLKTGSKKKLSSETNIPIKEIEGKLSASWVTDSSFVPITQLAAGDQKQITKLASIPGVIVHQVPARIYPYHKAAGHLTGYIGTITADELKNLKGKGYNSTDKIGKTGLEALFENRLKGKDGGVIYTTDKNGNRLKTIAKRPVKNGDTIKLTINAELQKKLYQEMAKDNDAGTAAAIDPKTGEVLALVSTPSYDPNQFILGLSNKQWKALQSNPKKPLQNRFAQAYAPGSAFKPITAAIALKTNSIDPNKIRHITGPWQPDKSWGNYRVTRVDHVTSLNLQDALVRSDNIYFAQTALKIGPKTFMKQAKQFGMEGKLPSFPFPIQPAQITNNGKFSSQIQLANTGYGQGQVLTSTLQLAASYTPFVNGGNLLKPILEMKNANNVPQVWKKNVISPKIANTVVQDLVQVVEKPYGTATGAQIAGVTIAGKTGTAELKKNRKVKDGKENGWFVGFNVKDPKIMIAMMIQNVQDEGGSHYVVPKVADTLKWYLQKH